MRTAFINIAKIYGTHSSHIQRLSGLEMSQMPCVENGYVIIADGRFSEIGSMVDLIEDLSTLTVIDLKGASILPTYCDSHTHIVFAEPREHEFEMKIKGMSYEEIAAKGGGILNSADKLGKMSFEDLYEKASERLASLIRMGTGAIEIKSGYGLTLNSEIKMLEVIRKLKENFSIPIKSTFLGAHAIPSIYKSDPERYLTEVIAPCIERVGKENLADFVDIFIEKNYFSLAMSARILDLSDRYGLKPKLHVNQLSNMGGVQFGVDRKALSVDHLEEISQIEIDYLKGTETMATLLPSCSFFIKIPYAPARQMIDSGLSIALASDYNPGSTPSGNMNFVMSLACIYQKMNPVEALNAASINGAYAMNLSNEVGSITEGKQANFIVSQEMNSLASIPYSFGRNLMKDVYINGVVY